ncbi:SPBc2 prophage-derived glycosyltransferase SunS [Clostridioides difficile]|nr:glycosyltransferase [Clostridioides sp. ZZV14-6387]NJI82293.1 glycosyltransferase [Clostridioides difficile]CZR95488.1 SPBc2 prophage-derived glycosyltransferase SunS [Clostridioides difficile]CZR99986.1 SPBc2 prophage-derived glycosyltransferase SunS [Clostridioides difficile]
MLLSIVMMVKNEDKILDKTLKSLSTLRNSIENELIIVDTGSTDDTIRIAKEHTEKVYFHNWNDDFSSMRNISISYAKGKWLLILDADEILIDCSNIIRFFEDGLDKKFNSASVRLKNLYSFDKKSYGHCSVLRLFKNVDFKYCGKVHEQPMYKNPIFNNIADFEHYGYLLEDEEVRINKVKRNEKLLFEELKENENSPYINYQLGKNFIILGKYREALDYFEKSYKLYLKLEVVPGYLITNIAKVYLYLGKHKKCEKLCLKYISKDRNNIDIYYYIGQAQVGLGKYEDSIYSYKRYIYLLDNYEISTQANSLFSDTDTIGLRDEATITLIKIYYKLEKYDLVISEYDNIKNMEKKKNVYFNLFMSLYKLDRFEDIKSYYKEVPNSKVERNSFYRNIEEFINNVKDDEKDSIYRSLCAIEGNYGLLNNIRINKHVSIDMCKKILDEEKDVIYAGIIKIAFEEKVDLLDIFYDMDYVWIEKYLNHLLALERSSNLSIYKYIIGRPNTSKIEKIRVYKVISKVVLQNVSLSDEKYKELFYIYIMYSYKYIKYIYSNLNDFELMKFVCNDIDKFTLEFKHLLDGKSKINDVNEKLEYIHNMRKLLNEYPFYNKIIKIFISELEESIKESEEFNLLKDSFIIHIENMIENGKINDAKLLIEDYSKSFIDDVNILNIKGILFMCEDKFEEADFMFKKALSLDIENEDTIYNIEYLKNLK